MPLEPHAECDQWTTLYGIGFSSPTNHKKESSPTRPQTQEGQPFFGPKAAFGLTESQFRA